MQPFAEQALSGRAFTLERSIPFVLPLLFVSPSGEPVSGNLDLISVAGLRILVILSRGH